MTVTMNQLDSLDRSELALLLSTGTEEMTDLVTLRFGVTSCSTRLTVLEASSTVPCTPLINDFPIDEDDEDDWEDEDDEDDDEEDDEDEDDDLFIDDEDEDEEFDDEDEDEEFEEDED